MIKSIYYDAMPSEEHRYAEEHIKKQAPSQTKTAPLVWWETPGMTSPGLTLLQQGGYFKDMSLLPQQIKF